MKKQNKTTITKNTKRKGKKKEKRKEEKRKKKRGFSPGTQHLLRAGKYFYHYATWVMNERIIFYLKHFS